MSHKLLNSSVESSMGDIPLNKDFNRMKFHLREERKTSRSIARFSNLDCIPPFEREDPCHPDNRKTSTEGQGWQSTTWSTTIRSSLLIMRLFQARELSILPFITLREQFGRIYRKFTIMITLRLPLLAEHALVLAR